MDLRPYQTAARDAVLAAWARYRRLLLVLPTGTGKTVVFAHVALRRVEALDRVLILAHRGELLHQAADKLTAATGLRCAVEKAEQSSRDTLYRVTVGSVQSLCRPERLAEFGQDYWQTIIVDEAHHALSDSYQSVLASCPSANVLGVTATPSRGDQRELGEYFEHIAYEMSLRDAVSEGWLCPIRAETIPLGIDLGNARLTGSTEALTEVAHRLEPYLAQIVQEMVPRCRGRKTVVFLPLIDTSRKFRDLCEAAGFRAAEVNGESPDRAEILADFEAGRYDVLCNSMLLTEGWDCPSVDTIVVLRPTQVSELYRQMVGRGTRRHPGKDHLLLLDFLWHTDRHVLCHPACLIAPDDAVSAKMQAMQDAAGGPVDVAACEAAAESSVVEEREQALADKLAKLRRRKLRLVDPLQYAASVGAYELTDYVPTFAADAVPATPDQQSAIEATGIDPTGLCAGHADAVLAAIAARRDGATPKQIRKLEQYGFRHVGQWTAQQAGTMMGRLSANGWRPPRGVTPSKYQPQEDNQ